MMNKAADNALATALGARRGVICLVGAGGKKTTMYALAAAHVGRVALSSTAHMYRYDQREVDAVVSVVDGMEPPPGPASARVVAYAGATDTAQRVGGLDAQQLAHIWARGDFDLLLVKADGARARRIKAPADYEPLIPHFADTVIAVVAATVLGQTLDERIAHRPELAAAVMGTDLQTPLTPRHIARLLSSERGALKGVGAAAVVPLINMVDDADMHAQAGDAARLALSMTKRFDRVVLATMKTRQLVEVIER
jgi:probable selenium-dependent hydroxylase accessory protein YqeC